MFLDSQEIDWEATPAKAGKPSDYIELLIKETSQLHKILSKYLPESTVEVRSFCASARFERSL